MVVAELEVFHSRPIAPTRRVALGDSRLPHDGRFAPGPVLLAAVVAAHVGAIDPELHGDLQRLMSDVEQGRRIAQPRVRHRFQSDRVGLLRSRHRLVAVGSQLDLDLDDRGAPIQQALAAVYAVGTFPLHQRRRVMDLVRQGAAWDGPIDRRLLAHLNGTGPDLRGMWVPPGDPVPWALSVFGFDADPEDIDRQQVQRRYRQLLRDAHPDHGGATATAATRIAELAEARRILLA